MSYLIALWILLILGVIPALIFLFTHIPSRRTRWTVAALDASGWVAIICLLYIWMMFRLVHVPYYYHRAWDAGTISSVVIGIILDAVIWLRLGHWIWFRKQEKKKVMQRD
jgi:hypothetical protein